MGWDGRMGMQGGNEEMVFYQPFLKRCITVKKNANR